MSSANKALVLRYVNDVLNTGDVRHLHEFVAEDYVLHGVQGDVYGPEGVRISVMELRCGFPDAVFTIEDLLADGDWVVRRFQLKGTHLGPYLGIPGSGRSVSVQGICLDRVQDGRLVESWRAIDTMNLLRQMGCTLQQRRAVAQAGATRPDVVPMPFPQY